MTNLYAPPQAIVQDIDPAVGILLANRGARLGASMLDGILFMLMVYAPLILATLLSGGAKAASTGNDSGAAFGIGMVAALIGLLVWLAINIKFMKANGQSIGKKACAIKVVRRDGSPVSLSRLIWLRNAVNLILGMVPLYGLIDALFIFGDARRCVHDHLADTIVIKA
jgi:uncharacterized RDD family membrane protein YckC